MRRRRFLQHLLLAGGFLALIACHQAPLPPAYAFAQPLPALVAERLLLAREVAWAKLHSGAPVQDPAREASLLADLVAQGRKRGLDAGRVGRFFTAQIAASREVQTELLAAWRTGAAPRPAHPPLDLRADLRPRLDALTPRLFDAFPTRPSGALADATAQKLAAAGFSPAVIALATAPLRP